MILFQALLLLIDGFPATITLLGIASHVIYLQNMRRFPVVKLSDPLFILSCGKLSRPNYLSTQAQKLIGHGSTGSSQSLRMLLPLLRVGSKIRSIIPSIHFPDHTFQHPDVHRDSLLLRSLRLARPIRSFRFLVRERQCASNNRQRGFRKEE